MIKTFATKETAAVFAGLFVRRLPRELMPRAKMRLDQINAAGVVEDLRMPPANRLEKLKGNRKGQWSIRINSQWRVCFLFQNGDAFGVEITDCH